MNIVILAAGPPKPNRNRHLEIFNSRPLILNVIESCEIENTNLYIVINKKNIHMINYVNNLKKNIIILYPKDEKIESTLIKALSIEGDCILVNGDLINIKKHDILKFVNTKYSSALCRYKYPWGNNIISSTGKIRRSDIGDCIVKISDIEKKKYLSKDINEKANNYFSDFYPNKKINLNIQNDLGTHINYAYFYNIWSNPLMNEYKHIGSIYYEKNIYKDND